MGSPTPRQLEGETMEPYEQLYREAEARIWKMKNYFIRSVALNFVLAAVVAALINMMVTS